MIKDNPDYRTPEYKNTLNFYLTENLNLELVNIILTSIVSFTKYAEKTKKSKDRATFKMQEIIEKKRKTIM
jgi:hypothetical protein